MPEEINDDDDLEPGSKKRKEKVIYGVYSEKWHTKKKVSTQARLRLSNTVEEEAYEKRESVFDSLRPELCVEFRYSER